MARCHELRHGAIDRHTHSAPSIFDRLREDVGLAEQARAAGMRAVLYKAHEPDTTGPGSPGATRRVGLEPSGAWC